MSLGMLSMPKKRNQSSSCKAIIVLVIICVVGLSYVAWHDGVIGTTSIKAINDGDVSTGTRVTVKGQLTLRLGNLHTISTLDGHNTLVFVWEGVSPAIDSIIVVRGTVSSVLSLSNVTSVETVWWFK